MKRSFRYLLALLALILAYQAHVATAADVRPARRKAAIEDAARRGDAFWRQIATAEPRPTSGCRQLLGYALALCEARVHPERLERLFVLTRQMQDQDPHSKNWGNLRWYWRDAGVTDTNAVEFCMQDALLIHIRHGDWLPPAAKKELADLLRLGVEGCLRHRVPTDYTNIAILNAGNLIVLGERLDRADAAREGYRRLDAICLRTAAFGVHEFCSPTYYGTDLNGLLLIHTYARGKRERQQAEALLQLFWTDIAANWFPAAQRLGGCHSRSYDYLRGLGGLDWHLWIHGWLESPSAGSAERREPWTDEWSPPPSLVEMGRRSFPAGFASTGEFCRPKAAATCCITTSRSRAAAPGTEIRIQRWRSICPAAANSRAATSFPTAARIPTARRNTKRVPPGTPRPCILQPFWAGRNDRAMPWGW